jgi:single-strand DNA-binding protein
MSNSYNNVQLLGNLGDDAALSVLQSGKSYLKFSVACNEVWKDNNGEKKEKTNWFNCTLWGDRATALAQYLKKGNPVFVTGSLQNNKVEKDGVTKYFTEVNVREVCLISSSGKKSDADESGAGPDTDAEDPWKGAGV